MEIVRAYLAQGKAASDRLTRTACIGLFATEADNEKIKAKT